MCDAETIAVHADGSLFLPDKFGDVYIAMPTDTYNEDNKIYKPNCTTTSTGTLSSCNTTASAQHHSDSGSSSVEGTSTEFTGMGGGYTLISNAPVAQLGMGRPLGTAIDSHGNLIACDVVKVSHAAHMITT